MSEMHSDQLQSANTIVMEGVRVLISAARGDDVIFNVMCGLHCLVQLASHPGNIGITETNLNAWTQALSEAAPILAKCVDGVLSPDHVNTGVSDAVGLMNLLGKSPDQVAVIASPELILDYVDHVAIFGAELIVINRRQCIQQRGGPLRKLSVIQRFVQSLPNYTLH